jgi:hypothetical protein
VLYQINWGVNFCVPWSAEIVWGRAVPAVLAIGTAPKRATIARRAGLNESINL